MDDEWRPINTAPEDGSFLFVKLASGHVMLARRFPYGWMAEVTDQWCDAVLDGTPMPDWTEESRIGWAPAPGQPDDLPSEECRDDDIPF